VKTPADLLEYVLEHWRAALGPAPVDVNAFVHYPGQTLLIDIPV